MTQDQWSTVESTFDALHDLPPEQRADALDKIADPEIRSEVASLLRHVHEGETVASAIGAVAVEAEAASATIGISKDQRIGPYRLVRRVGHGGQGAVFEAVRDDGSFQQRVAIKIVKWDIDSELTRERFRQERQILAGLEHPNIARLLDGGETAEGAPYLVMEYVDGQPLTNAAKGWPARRKLELFLEVAAAVAFAHRNLIVHRDLKPANILVAKDGTPKLLDFGIAKLLDSDPQRTLTLMQALTPDYASPEQIRGLPISTASDVYSLGVVLYQLLTGRKPYTLETGSALEMDRVICVQPPAEPRLGDELDHIVLMAMRKEPERRYASVEQFAADIRNYLDHRPVRARPDTLAYRAGKFARRNTWQIAAGVLLAASLVGGTGVSMQQARRADRRFQQVRKLANSFLFEFHDKIATLPGSTEARELIVKTALEYLDNLAAESGNDPGLQWELAAAYMRVGDVQGSDSEGGLGHNDQAWASYRKAQGILTKLAAARRPDDRVFESLSSLDLKLSGRPREAARSADRLPLMKESLKAAQSMSPAAGDRRARQLAAVHTAMGSLDEETGDATGAVREFRASLDSLGTVSDHQGVLRQMANTRRSLANSLADLSDFKSAVASCQSAADTQEAMVRRDPRNTSYLSDLYSTYQLGISLSMAVRDTAGAQRQCRRCVEIAEQLAAADPKNAVAQRRLAAAWLNSGNMARTFDKAQAAVYFQNAIGVIDGLLKLDPSASTTIRMHAVAQSGLAVILVQLGRLAEARNNLTECTRTLEALAAADPKRTLFDSDRIANNQIWGDLEMASHNTASGLEYYGRAAAIAEKMVAASPLRQPRTQLYYIYERFVTFYLKAPHTAGNCAAGRKWYEKNLPVWTGLNKQAPMSQSDIAQHERDIREIAACGAPRS